jgi:hypothetical protein
MDTIGFGYNKRQWIKVNKQQRQWIKVYKLELYTSLEDRL